MNENTTNETRTPASESGDAAASESGASSRPLEESIRAVSVHVVNGRAAADLVRAAYERAFYVVKPEERKRWGTLAAQLQAGWDDPAGVAAARTEVDGLVTDLVALGKRMKQTIGAPVIVVASCLTLLAIVQHALYRRCDEVAACVSQGDGLAAGVAARGGVAEAVETQPS